MNQFDQSNPIPMPPPVSNTLMNLQAPNTYNSNTASLPGLNGGPAQDTPATVQPVPTSVINLSNSSDVVIGPMTQYQGAVTIYQYMDATVERRSHSIMGNIYLISWSDILICLVDEKNDETK